MEKIAALEDAIEKNNLVGIYSVFYTIAHGDPNFSTGKFRTVLEYVKSKNIDGLMQEFDGEEFDPEENWDEDYWALMASSLVDNFCEERINHLEVVGKKVYSVKNNPANRTVQLTNSNRGLITEKQKMGVKFEHANRTRKDDGGFLSRIFGPRRK